VIVIDELFASRYWPGEDPLGKRIRLGGRMPNNPLITVVGVVRRVKMEGLDNDSNRVQGYFPYAQRSFSGFTLVVRTSAEPVSVASSARRAVLELDSSQPVFNVRTMEEIRADSITSRRLTTTLLAIFAAVALLLAAIGIYGVMAYSVTQRTHEIGIRIALGAARKDVLGLIVGQGMLLAGGGVVIGLGASLLVTRWMTDLFFETGARDPLTFGAISAFLVAVALAATFIPATRAAKVDPIVALRYE
jgi:putative ABC transport system permease protein